jgi:hypothetical protein
MHTFYSGSTYALRLFIYLYCIVVSNMFRPLMQPSSGLYENKNTVIVKMCLNQSTALQKKAYNFRLTFWHGSFTFKF